MQPTVNQLELSVVVPVYNEADSVDALYRELDAACASFHSRVEFIFVDDGSRDNSQEQLKLLSEKDPRVRLILLDRNWGQSAAFDAGFRAVRGEITVTLDADLQNDPADIPRLIAALKDGNADLVNGVRAKRRDRWVRKVASRIANGVRNRITRESVSDVGCSIRAFRSHLLSNLTMYDGMHRFLPTLLRMQGARVIEIPVGHRPRRFGESKYGIWGRLKVTLFDLFAVRWMQSRALSYQATEWGVEAEGRDSGLPR